MKTVFLFGALAAFCESAYSFKAGVYTIVAKNNLYLTGERPPNWLISFSEPNQQDNQKWAIEPNLHDDSKSYSIKLWNGNFINCEYFYDFICREGGSPQYFTIQSTGYGDDYQFLDDSGRALCLKDETQLQAAFSSGWSRDNLFRLNLIASFE